MMDIQKVDSKKTILNESDILVVAAHDSDLSELQDSAEQHGVSPERMMYTIYASLLQNPALVLLREGNTLFAIAAGEERVGVVLLFNGDVETNFVKNFNEFLKAAHKLGFNTLVINDHSDIFENNVDEIEKANQDDHFSKDEEIGMIVIEFNEPHGD